MTPTNIIFLGRSGSGKGTQAKLLQKKFGLVNIDTGGLLRKLAQKKDDLGKEISRNINKGSLVPQWLVVYCWLQQLRTISVKKGVIMEGAPRRLNEAKVLEEIFHWLGRDKIKVIYLNVPAREVTKRLLARRICANCGKEYSLLFTPGIKKCSVCGGKLIRRSDDYPKAIKNRMLFFQTEIIPIINYFRRKKMLVEVDGIGSIEDIHRRIVAKLGKKI